MRSPLFTCLFPLLIASVCSYSVPEPRVELINPKGVRISIPDEKGIALVAFHMNLDKTIALHQPGDYAAEVTQPTNGRWVFDNTQVFVEPQDEVHYWLHVQYGSYAYRKQGIAKIQDGMVDIDQPTPRPTPRPTPSAVTDDEDGCELSKTIVNRKAACKGQLIFEDNFDSLNWTTWKREIRIPLDDVEFVSYQGREENCYTRDGQLHIVPSLLRDTLGFNDTSIRLGTLDLGTECTGITDIQQECTRKAQYSNILPPVVSARIRTKDSFSFLYGKVEVRAKMPRGDWLFPLILLEPLENYYGFTGYASGQMRVAFIRANEVLEDQDGIEISGHRIAGGVVLSTKESLRDIWLTGSLRRDHLADDFHTYILTWTDKYIAVEVDGNEYAIIRGDFARLYRTHQVAHAKVWDNGNTMAPFDREFFLTLGVSVGGHADFPDGCKNGPQRAPKPWTNTHPKAELHFWNNRENWLKSWNGEKAGLHVDYIRVYAL